MVCYGYIKKSRFIKSVDQINALLAYKCEDIFIEEELPEQNDEWKKCINTLEKEDTLVIIKLSSLGNIVNKENGLDFLKIIKEHRIRFIAIQDEIDTLKNQSFIKHFEVIYRSGLEYYKENFRIGIENKRIRGIYLGRPKLDNNTALKIKKYYHEHGMTMRNIAEKCNVSLGTVHKYVKDN